jgi:hypothetical protein
MFGKYAHNVVCELRIRVFKGRLNIMNRDFNIGEAQPSLDTSVLDRRHHEYGSGMRKLTFYVAGVAAGVALLAACTSEGDSEVPDSTTMATSTTIESNTTTTATIEEQRKEIIDLLTVTDESGFNCVTDIDKTAKLGLLDDGSVIVVPRLVSTLPVNSEERTQDNRLHSDSIANPMSHKESGDTKQDTLREFQSTMCESPEVASMVAHYFANLKVDGIEVVNLNPWLEEYEGDDSIINDRALALVPQYVDPLNTSPEEAQEANAVHSKLAGMLATLLERFENAGIEGDIETTFNYHLGTGGLQVGGLAEITENKVQYVGDFLVLELTTKDGRCAEVVLINVDDQRIATTDTCEVVPEPETTVTTKPIKITPTTVPDTSETTIPNKNDDGVLPGNPDVPADQDPGTPDVPGEGGAGQTPNADGTITGETLPQAQPPTTTPPDTTTTTEASPATTNPSPPITQAPVPVPTTDTTTPPTSLPPKP